MKFQLSREYKQEQKHKEIFNYCKNLNTIMENSNMLEQESGNLNNTTRRVTAPKEYRNIFTQLKYS